MSIETDELSQFVDLLYRYALASTRNHDLASEIAQDTILRALERGDQYRGDAPLKHWLLRIAHNLVVDRARSSSREIVVEEVEEAWRDQDHTVDAEAIIEQAATRDELLDALLRLPDIYRSTIVLHDVEGLRVRDIAQIQEVSLPAAKQRLRRGRMAMIAALETGAQRRQVTRGVPMRCWDVRKDIGDYLDGEISDSQAAQFQTHLHDCPTCPPLYASLVGVRAELGRLRDSDAVIAPDLRRQILAHTEK